MRFLIDGYNLMYARGLLGKRGGSDAFRKARTRFLNELADALGAVDAHLTTVVFDADAPPENLPHTATHKGISIIFAVDDENADERIEHLIGEHSSPKTLTVVSSDNRIRQAATRRKARALSTDDFLTLLEARQSPPMEAAPAPEERRDQPLAPEEADFWLDQFRDLEQHPETSAAFQDDVGIPSAAEIAEIEREVEREFESDR